MGGLRSLDGGSYLLLLETINLTLNYSIIVQIFNTTKYLRWTWFRSIGQLQGPYWGRLWTEKMGWGMFPKMLLPQLASNFQSQQKNWSIPHQKALPLYLKTLAEVLFSYKATWALRRIFSKSNSCQVMLNSSAASSLAGPESGGKDWDHRNHKKKLASARLNSEGMWSRGPGAWTGQGEFINFWD